MQHLLIIFIAVCLGVCLFYFRHRSAAKKLWVLGVFLAAGAAVITPWVLNQTASATTTIAVYIVIGVLTLALTALVVVFPRKSAPLTEDAIARYHFKEEAAAPMAPALGAAMPASALQAGSWELMQGALPAPEGIAIDKTQEDRPQTISESIMAQAPRTGLGMRQARLVFGRGERARILPDKQAEPRPDIAQEANPAQDIPKTLAEDSVLFFRYRDARVYRLVSAHALRCRPRSRYRAVSDLWPQEVPLHPPQAANPGYVEKLPVVRGVWLLKADLGSCVPRKRRLPILPPEAMPDSIKKVQKVVRIRFIPARIAFRPRNRQGMDTSIPVLPPHSLPEPVSQAHEPEKLRPEKRKRPVATGAVYRPTNQSLPAHLQAERMGDEALLDHAFALKWDGQWMEAGQAFWEFRQGAQAPWLRKQADIERLSCLVMAGLREETVDFIFFILENQYDLSQQERAQVMEVLDGLSR